MISVTKMLVHFSLDVTCTFLPRCKLTGDSHLFLKKSSVYNLISLRTNENLPLIYIEGEM